MKRTMRMKQDGKRKNTTRYGPLDEPAPMRNFYTNTERLASAGLGEKGKIIVVISTEPFAEGDVALAAPAVPYFGLTSNMVRYEHRELKDGKERQAANTQDLPVTRAYVEKFALDERFITERKPIFFGVSGIMEFAGDDADLADKIADAVPEVAVEIADGGIAAFDVFLRESVREEDGKLTTRRIWRVWAALWGADPDDPVIAGVRFTDVAGRVRAILGAVAAKNPTRVDGILQRYWPGYAI